MIGKLLSIDLAKQGITVLNIHVCLPRFSFPLPPFLPD